MGTRKTVALAISNLRDRPEFCEVVADRVWRAWWEPRGYSVEYVAGRVRDSLNSAPIPFTLVAHQNDRFVGTASIIFSDLPERPQFSPWIAAVWVDPDHRGRGVASALVRQAASEIFAQDIGHAYICATPENRPLYEGLGWERIEENVGPHKLTVLCMTRETP